MPTQPRARSLWLLAAGLPLAFVSGCPQLASDGYTKTDLPSDSGGSGGSSAAGSGGAGGTTPTIAITAATSSGGSETAASTSQGGTDPGSGGTEGNADLDTTSSTETTTAAETTTSETTTSETTTSETTTSETTTDGTTTDGGNTCMSEEICDGLDNDCNDEIDDGEICGWDSGCEGFAIDGHGYMFCGRPRSNGEAAAECSGQGMTLVQIDSSDENDALVAEADQRWNSEGGSGGTNDGGGTWGGTRGGQGEEQQPAFWTGGSDEDSEGSWIWKGSETPFWEGDGAGVAVGDAYSNWGAGRPNDANDTPENCAAAYFREGEDGEVGTWNDLECGDPYPFICESL